MDRCRDVHRSNLPAQEHGVAGQGSLTSAVELTFLRRYRLRNGVLANHASFLFDPLGGTGLAKQVFHSPYTEHQEYKSFSKLGLPNISMSMLFKVIAAAISLAILLFGVIKALVAAIKKLFKTIKKVTSYAASMKMPSLSGDFLPDIPGLPKMPKLAIPGVPGLPSPPKLSLGKAFSMLGLGMSALLMPLAILAAIALLTKYRIFKARLWPPLSGLPGLRNGLYRLPYRGFKGVFSHLPYFDQLYNAGGRFLPVVGLPEAAQNPGKQPMSPRIPKPKIEGPGALDYDMVMRDYQFSHGVNLGKSVLVPSIILNLSMRFKQFKEMVPLMGPPTVKEMFGTEGIIKKLQRLLVKGAMAYGAAKATGFAIQEGTCPWPSAKLAGSSALSFAQFAEGLVLAQFAERGLDPDGHAERDESLTTMPAKTTWPVLQAGMSDEALGTALSLSQSFPERRMLCEEGTPKIWKRVQLHNFL